MIKTLINYRYHALIFFVAFSVLTIFKFDPDFGWHLATGNRFLETFQVARYDYFSWTMSGHPFSLSYILYQVFVSFLFSKIGYLNLVLFMGLMAAISVLLLLPKKVDLWKFLVILPGILMITINFGVRPHTFSFLFFVIELLVLDKGLFKGFWRIPFWFFLFVLWTNFHQGYTFGLAILVFYTFFDYLWRKSLREKPSLTIAVFSVIAAFLGTLVNPYGLGFWAEILGEFLGQRSFPVISEFQSVVTFFPINILFGLSGVIFVQIFRKNIKKINPPIFICASILFVFGFFLVLCLFFWAAIYIYLVSRFFESNIDHKHGFILRLPIISSTIAIILVMFLGFVIGLVKTSTLESRLYYDNYPVDAIKFLLEKKMTVNVYNDYNWGGFIDWYAPSIPVFIDGRMAGWKQNGHSVMEDFLSVRAVKCGVLDKYDIKVFLVPVGLKNPCFLKLNKIYEDRVAQILVR